VLEPVSFREVAADVIEIQEKIGFSSAAVEALLQQANFKKDCVLARQYQGLSEENLRKKTRLFHHVRILPDLELVQQLFDAIQPYQCNNARCRGGVQWGSDAEKHLGREGILLKIDKDDDTVLVETIGACQCRVWFPRLAVEPVFNMDLSEEPLFEVHARVECRMENGWSMGVVEQVLWHGPDRYGPCPYTVKLDDGRSIFVPHTHLIRQAWPGQEFEQHEFS
jgi:hypothetical protein